MEATEHMKQRMAQRGKNREMVNLVLNFGTPKQDKITLSRDEAQEQLRQLQQAMRVLKKILAKGGVTVITGGNAWITTYNFNLRRH